MIIDIQTIIIGVFLLAGFVIASIYYSEKQRTQEMEKLAKQLGAKSFVKVSDLNAYDVDDSLALFSRGRKKILKNIITGEMYNLSFALFDYQYTTRGNKGGSITHKQSVLFFESKELCLSEFSVRPETIVEKILSTFGFQDIDFENHSKFSAQYLLRGVNETEIRQTFNADVISLFEKQTYLCCDGRGNQIIFYRQRTLLKSEELIKFFNEGLKLFGAFNNNMYFQIDILPKICYCPSCAMALSLTDIQRKNKAFSCTSCKQEFKFLIPEI